ncbi:CBBY-like protein [Silene latifolia]|uniref:CBBY-like protein n=1 Tax=Silene latifolia TaxID=37657 RepID=UPI003D76CB34
MEATLTSSPRHSSLINFSINGRNTQRHHFFRYPTHFSKTTTNCVSHLETLCFGPKIRRRFCNWLTCCSNSLTPLNDDNSSSNLAAVLLEVDGVLIDAYRTGNRHGFNVAFRKLGLDCANWTQPIYLDLFRKCAADEEKMLASYFNRIGWPTSLPTSEKNTFVKSVLQEKKKALAEFVSSANASLRPGVEKFIDDACDEGISVVILTTLSKFGEETARAIVEKLGHERMSKLKVIGKEDVEKSFYGKLVLGLQKSSGPEEELANEASKAVATERQKIAKEVASLLKLRVDINTGTPESIRETVVALRTGAENAEASVSNCVLVAGSQSAIAAAEITGMPCVVLRSSMTSRAEFPATVSVMDGFGDVDLTISKLQLTLSRLSQ